MNVLSLRGGGIRGLVVAMILAYVEAVTGRPIRALFDLIAGTSTGGIIAIALSLGIPAKQIVRLYVEDGPLIFQRRWLLGLIQARYSIHNMRKVLQKHFGDAVFGDCSTRTMVTALEVRTNKAHLIKSWKHGGISAVDAASATAAAPTYFDPVRIPPCVAFEGGEFIDGGIFANNPAVQAMVEAWKLNNRSNTLKLVDLACPSPTRQPGAPRAGVIGLLPRLADMFLDAGVDSASHIASVAMNGSYLAVIPSLHDASADMADASLVNIHDLRVAGEQQADKLGWQIVKHITPKETTAA